MGITKEQMMKLQNGSDVRGIALKAEDGPPVSLTEEAVNRITQSFVLWLAEKKQADPRSLKIGVGYDSRITAQAFKSEVLKGILSQGARAFDCGLASTPSLFMSVQLPETAYDGGLMITASHLPYIHNGMKFFYAGGGLDKGDISAILEDAGRRTPLSADIFQVEEVDLISLYAAGLREKICSGVGAADYARPLAGLRIAVDAGNGAGGFFVEQVLRPLGADTMGSQFLEPDGMFPNHAPNPENKEAMDSLRESVINNHADLGIIFDTDVDRMSAVLGDGTEVNRDAIIAMMAAIIAPEYPGAAIVTDSVTSHRLTDFIQNTLGMRHHRFKRGYKNVINEAQRLCGEGIAAPLAIETSGHGALQENYFLDDGAYMAVKLLIAAAKMKNQGKTIAALIEKLPPAFEEREYRLRIRTEDFGGYGQAVLTAFENRAREAGYSIVPDSFEGIRLSFAGLEIKGWLLLRMSLHDPLMPLNMEGEREGDCLRMLEIVRALLKDFDKLDLSTWC